MIGLKFKTPPTFTKDEARLAIDLLEVVIDALIELHAAMARLYDLRPTPDDDIPF